MEKKAVDFSKLKYFKNDRPPKPGQKFTDPNFPPNDNSLLGKNEKGEFIDKVDGETKSKRINPSDIVWKRASEIFQGQKYLLFEDKIECDDINQGKLGDCYFLASLAALCSYPTLVYKMFRTKTINSEGYFEIIFYIDGRQQIVVIDDYLPVLKSTGKIAYAQPNKNEIWVCMIEKAWAKVNGGYCLIISGWMRHALQAFTSFGNISCTHSVIKKEDLWKLLKYASEQHCLISSSSRSNAEDKKEGLVKSHAYTVCKVLKIQSKGNKVKLVKMRNTWGFKEWTGPWCDNSPLWGPEELAQVEGFQCADDGTFFMSYDDYFDNYIVTDICYLQYKSHSKSTIIGKENDEFKKGNVFNLYMPEDGFLSINLMRKMWRFNRELRGIIIPSFLLLFKVELVDGVTNIVEMYSVIDSHEDVAISKELTKGLYVLYAYREYNTFKTPEDTSYTIKVDSPVDFRYQKMKADDPEENFPYLTSALLRYLSTKHYFKLGKERTVLNLPKVETSGLGVRLFYNESEKPLHVTVGTKGLKNLKVISPKPDKEECHLYVPPQDYGMVLAMTKDSKTKTDFPTEVKLGYVKQMPKMPKFDVNDYENFNFLNEAYNPTKNQGYYDYTTASLEEASKEMQFEVLDMGELTFAKLEALDPKYAALLKQLKPVENDKNLSWTSKKNVNGQYYCQMNKNNRKEGRAVVIGKSTYFVGYYKGDYKNGEGKEYNKADDRLIFEGNYVNGLKQGHGKFYYNNGDIFEGEFVKDKKEGKGKHFFKKNGSVWEGNYANNLMDDTGTVTFKSGKTSKATYVKGVLQKK